jgi:hypothetical protein
MSERLSSLNRAKLDEGIATGALDATTGQAVVDAGVTEATVIAEQVCRVISSSIQNI